MMEGIGYLYSEAPLVNSENSFISLSNVVLEETEEAEGLSYLALENASDRVDEETCNHVDDELHHLIASWGFVDLYEHFRTIGVTVNILKVIDNEDLKEMFANKPFAVRVEFKHKLYQWRTENVNTDSQYCIMFSIILINVFYRDFIIIQIQHGRLRVI